MTKITIGARGSKLSIAYVEKVKKLLIQKNNDLKEESIDFKAIKTSGDVNQNVKLERLSRDPVFNGTDMPKKVRDLIDDNPTEERAQEAIDKINKQIKELRKQNKGVK